MMIVEQMSEHREQQALQSRKTSATSPATDTASTPAVGAGAVVVTASTADTGKGHEKAGAVGQNTYGVLVNTCVIRDLGMWYVGHSTQQLAFLFV